MDLCTSLRELQPKAAGSEGVSRAQAMADAAVAQAQHTAVAAASTAAAMVNIPARNVLDSSS